MKLKLQNNQLRQKLIVASMFSSNKLSSLPALQGVYLNKDKNKIDIHSTNLTTYYHSDIECKDDGKFSIIIEARKILEFLNLLNDGEIEIEVKEKQLTISKGKTKGTFALIEGEDFPLPPKISEKEMSLDVELLSENLNYVVFAAAKDDSRPVLSGVNFIGEDDKLVIVATDGFRLSLVKINNIGKIPPMLVPAEFLQAVMRQAEREKKIGFSFSKEEKAIKFSAGKDEFYSRLIDGEFPPFEKVIPSESKTTAVLDKEELSRNVKIMSVFAREQSNIILMEFKKGELKIKTKEQDGESNVTSQDAETKGEEQIVAFNQKFITEFLNTISAEKVIVEIFRPEAPVVFRVEKKPEFLHIIMPIRIQT